MNWIDYFLVICIFLSCCIGIFRGFIKEILSSLMLGCTYFFILNYYNDFARLLYIIDTSLVREIVSIAILLSVSLVIGAILNKLFSLIIKKLNLSVFDKILGAFFGIFRGIFIIVLVLLFIQKFTKFSESLEWKQSQLIPQFFNIFTYCFHWLKTKYNFSFN